MMRRRVRQERSPAPARLVGRDRQSPPREDLPAELPPVEEARWTHLMNAAFHLQQAGENEPAARIRALRLSLQSALEAFQAAEPLDDLPGFAVRRMLLAMEEALEGADEAPERRPPTVVPPHLTPRR